VVIYEDKGQKDKKISSRLKMKKKSLRVLYHLPSIETIYGYRTIYNGFKNAFQDLGFSFFTLTSKDNLRDILIKTNPHIFITCSHNYYLKFLDLPFLMKFRKHNKMVMFTKIDFWNSPFSKFRINEAKSLKDEKDKVDMIKNGLLGDIFFHVVDQKDKRMKGFSKTTGKIFHTIPLAADKTLMFPNYDQKFKADISYIGTNLPQKKNYFKELLFPLSKKYKLNIYGQDWTIIDKSLGWIQRIGQYFNNSFLKGIQKPKLSLEDEGKIYSSTKICVNIHENYQRKFGGDINERFFKILACKAFQITDYVRWIDQNFNSDEVVYAKTKKEWFEKIDYYMKHPEERKKIAEKGYKKVIKKHTYHNRVKQMINLYKRFKENRN